MKKGLVLMMGLIVMMFVTEALAAATVKMGAILPLTGPLAREGQTVKNVMSFAVEEINALGGIKSLGGAKVELVFADNQSKPDVAISEVERLVETEKVIVLTEAWQSFITLAATRAAERVKTPYYAPNSYADSITERGLRYTFQQTSKASVLARNWVQFLDYVNKDFGKKISKVGLLYENTDMGQSSADAAKGYLPEAGFKVVADLSYPVRATDLTSFIAKLKAAEPDFVFQGGYMENAVLITKTADRLGLHVPFMDNGCMNDPSFNKAVGALAEGKFGVTSWNKDIPGGQKLYEKIRTRLVDISGIYMVGYQAIWVIKEALEKAGSAEREALRNALATIHIPGAKLYLPLEKVSFNEKGYNDKAEGWIITQVQNGEWFTVWPPKYASKKPILK